MHDTGAKHLFIAIAVLPFSPQTETDDFFAGYGGDSFQGDPVLPLDDVVIILGNDLVVGAVWADVLVFFSKPLMLGESDESGLSRGFSSLYCDMCIEP